MAFALGLCEKLLQDKGVCRIHGGGFSGTVQVFVPLDLLNNFRDAIEANLGRESYHALQIRPYGGIRVK